MYLPIPLPSPLEMAINDENLLKTCMVASSQNYRGLLCFLLKDISVHGVNVLGTTEHRWYTPSNGKNPLAMATRGVFNNEPANDRGPMFQENFKTSIVVYL